MSKRFNTNAMARRPNTELDFSVSLNPLGTPVQIVRAVKVAAADFSDYLAKSMGVVPSGSGRASVEIAVDPTLRRLQSKVEVAESSIRVTGATAREAFQGAIRLEDMMTARGIPAATRGVRTFTRLFSPRMTHSGWEVEKDRKSVV